MKKYIIKNCPAYREKIIETYPTLGVKQWEDVCAVNRNLDCKDITNCLIKNIIEKCNRNIDRVYYLGGLKVMQGQKLAVDILQQLEIEEINE